MCIFCLYMYCMCARCLQKLDEGTQDHPELKLQMVESVHIGTGKQTWIL